MNRARQREGETSASTKTKAGGQRKPQTETEYLQEALGVIADMKLSCTSCDASQPLGQISAGRRHCP